MTDFAAFGVSPTASVFGTAVTSTPFSLAGGKAAFGGLRNSGRGAIDDDDDDDDDGKQRVELREDSITLDQVGSLFYHWCRGHELTTSASSRHVVSLCRAHGGVRELRLSL